jgi:hypothetical protein
MSLHFFLKISVCSRGSQHSIPKGLMAVKKCSNMKAVRLMLKLDTLMQVDGAEH